MKVELRSISKHFGRIRANDNISLTIEPNTVHGLAGENGAGKTTLMRILAGYTRKDGGEIMLNNEAVAFSSPRDASARGIGLLHQDPMDIPVFSALENFMLGRTGGLKRNKKAFVQTFLKLADDLGFIIHPDESTAAMTTGTRQQLDIIRLLSSGTRLLILDEPTTGLSEDQKSILFKSLRTFAACGGNSVILVSHKISDIQKLCDHVTVLRKGRVSGSSAPPFDTSRILELMFGPRFIQSRRSPTRKGESVFTSTGLSAAGGRSGLQGCDLCIHRGEIIGLAGLEGSGQELFLKAAVGLIPALSGKITLRGEDITGSGYHMLRKKGVGYIPADRLNDGLVPDLTVTDHFLVAENPPVFAARSPRARLRAEKAIAGFQIRGEPDTPTRFLSGGNQQRLLLALIPESANILFLDKPTRGLDPESAALLWSRMQAFCETGGAIVFSSSDLDELLAMADRIAVFFNGRLFADLPVGETSVQSLEKAITGKRPATMEE